MVIAFLDRAFDFARGNLSRERGKENDEILHRTHSRHAYALIIRYQNTRKCSSSFLSSDFKNTIITDPTTAIWVIFMLFNSMLQKVLLMSVQRNFGMCAFNHVCAIAIWENYAKNMNMLNFMRETLGGQTMSESDAYVWKIISTWSARKALSTLVPAGRNCHWLSTGIDLKDVRWCQR